MKIPLSWLKEYVDFEDTLEGLRDKLTFSGLEVEAIETIGNIPDGVIVGEVTRVDPHPDADRLTVCRVHTGTEEVQVVCGAPNVKAGMKSAFAPVGVTVATGFKLKKAKIRGVVSLGMLCAEDELGLSGNHDGILELEETLVPGTALQEVLGPPEVVFELEVTPNRPDCLSLIGVARELAALYDTDLKLPEIDFEENGEAVTSLTSVAVADTEGCPRYTARVIKNMTIRPSPEWMQQRLTLCGIRPINNAVDITNYVMLECGHPLHAFDYNLLKENRIVVRRPAAGETLETLDGTQRELAPHHLVIADAERAVAVAGVMGGANSEILNTTETILLESGCFRAPMVRVTAKELDMNTESSYRFARGADIGNVDWASRRATALLARYGEGVVARGAIDVYPDPPLPRRVECRWAKVNGLLGIEVDPKEVMGIFTALGLEIEQHDAVSCAVFIPTYRTDLEREVDLVEEVARIHGLDMIPAPVPRAEIVPGADDRAITARRALRTRLVGLGLQETMNYSLTSEKILDVMHPEGAPERIVLPHPISQDQSVLRTSLLPQMVETLGRNRAHQAEEAALFEMGTTFHLEHGAHCERTKLSIGLMGPVGRAWQDKRTPVTSRDIFLWLKGLIESLSPALEFTAAASPLFEAGQCAAVQLDGTIIGRMGLVHSRIRHNWRMSDPVAAAELEVAPLLENYRDDKTMSPLPVYPAIVRDAALIAPTGLQHEQIMRVIQAAAGKELEKVTLFDIYQGGQLDAGRKSMAYSFTYRSTERTLTDEDANLFHEKIVSRLKKDLKIDIRTD